MKVLYLDCFSGISGDMCLGAMVGAGVGFGALKREIAKLGLGGYSISSRRVQRAGIESVKITVRLTAQEPARGWREINGIIARAELSDRVKERSLDCFRRLFEAEARVHGGKPELVHLHELGATDALIDIVGTMISMELLGVDKVFSSAINLGSGTVKAMHGVLPVPAPATLELLKGVPVYSSGPALELATPTGAAIAATLSEGFGPMPLMSVGAVGIGAGGHDPEGHANVLRVIIGEGMGVAAREDEGIWVVEASIDDMNPQVYEYVIGRLLETGALDVALAPVIMKKSRPGVIVKALCPANARTSVIETLFRETTTIGVRHYPVQRTVLDRKFEDAQTPWGKVRVKVSSLRAEVVRATPEYEDCVRLAKSSGVALLDVMDAARASFSRSGHRPTKARPRR